MDKNYRNYQLINNQEFINNYNINDLDSIINEKENITIFSNILKLNILMNCSDNEQLKIKYEKNN